MPGFHTTKNIAPWYVRTNHDDADDADDDDDDDGRSVIHYRWVHLYICTYVHMVYSMGPAPRIPA